tara:strand:- start:85 stop:786 length:702 start_codon:yes stop_codon:yes gene_type:complete
MKEITYIYLVTNCLGNTNNVYIGKTKNSRKSDHICTYGPDIEYGIIDQIESYDKNLWIPLESYWIEQLRQWGFNVLNKQMVGGSGVEFHTDETKLKMSLSKIGREIKWGGKISKSNQGRKHTDETKLKMSLSKIGKKYSDERNQKLRKPKTQEHKDNISKALKGKIKSKEYKDKISKIKSKPLLQFNKNGTFIKEWSSQTLAGEFLNKKPSAISEGCSGKRKTVYGFIWKYKQ